MSEQSKPQATTTETTLDSVRGRLQTGLILLSWVHVAIAVGIAFSVGASVQVALIASGSLALLTTLAPRITSPAVARYLLIVGLQGQAATFVGLLAGNAWQLDAHMYFFALMGIAVMLVDIGVLLAGAATVAVHHLALNFAIPALVYPGGADFGRTVLHAVILIAETAALIMAVAFIEKLLKVVASSQAATQIELERAQTAHSRMEQVEAESAERRSSMMMTLQSAFGAVVDAAVKGDFSKRAPTDFEDKELNGIAEGLNRLVATTDSGIAAADKSLKRLAGGKLRVDTSGEFQGRFADLQDGVHATAAQLSRLVSEIQTLSTAMRGSTEAIAGDSAELAKRAESQASSLEETAATMEEMSATIKSNSDSASQATTAANEASTCAERGGKVLTETVAAMNRIEAEAQKISEITSVIDGIAFQTNLLALNAAVEAARAGDAGKGFAVVASEVRELAQRSANAARDIKSLITESASQVEAGVTLVERTGESLSEIVTAVAQVAEKVTEISQATHEQSSGVNEIASAVSHLDQMTQQNASMAEQSASSAQVLAQQAERLSTLVSVFETDGATGARQSETVADAAWTAETRASSDRQKARQAAAVALAPVASAPVVADAVSGDSWSEF